MVYVIDYIGELARRKRRCIFISIIVVIFTAILLYNVDHVDARYLNLVRFNQASMLKSTEPQLKELRFSERIRPCTVEDPCRIMIVADLDKNSKVDDGYKTLFGEGLIYQDEDIWTVEWDAEPSICKSKYNEGGRGMELSELLLINGSMYTFDDRTGIIFEVMISPDGRYSVIAKSILVEGDGVSSEKGMKIEWATSKDGLMWIGSFGKEYTNPDGTIRNEWPLWVAAVDNNFTVRRKDWTNIYTKLREESGAPFPGYLLHEAVIWSPRYRQWVIAPRRWSDEPYDEVEDNLKGSNKIFLCSESFMKCAIHTVGEIRPKRGYSSIKIVPGTEDHVFVALKSEEEDQVDNAGKQRTYIQMFDRNGKVLLDDVLIPYEGKFEGIEFYIRK